LKEQLND
jgi:cation diffusion facilitator CzcD-associated flavoprotein CzcO